MIYTKISVGNGHYSCKPISISFLIKIANDFDCDIYLKCNNKKGFANVKNYDDLMCSLKSSNKDGFVFYFHGIDEVAALSRFNEIFSSSVSSTSY